MCKAACSESGKLLSIVPCEWYKKLQQERDILASTLAINITQLEALTDLLESNLKKLGKHDDECLMDFVERLVKIHEAADALAKAVEGIKPTVLYKRKPQDYVHMTDCDKMNALAVAFKAYKDVRDAE